MYLIYFWICIEKYFQRDINFFIDVPELAWTDVPNLYLNELLIQNTELQRKILFGLTVQKAHLNEIHRAQLYDKICSLSEINCNDTKTLCYSSLLNFAMLYPREISALIKEKFQLYNGKIINLIVHNTI